MSNENNLETLRELMLAVRKGEGGPELWTNLRTSSAAIVSYLAKTPTELLGTVHQKEEFIAIANPFLGFMAQAVKVAPLLDPWSKDAASTAMQMQRLFIQELQQERAASQK